MYILFIKVSSAQTQTGKQSKNYV